MFYGELLNEQIDLSPFHFVLCRSLAFSGTVAMTRQKYT